MPQVKLVLFREDNGGVPLLDWFDRLPSKALAKCRARLERLRDLGHELRRPRQTICATTFMSCAWV